MSRTLTSDAIADRVHTFTSRWTEISDAVAYAFRMDEEDRQWLSDKPIARLIGALPFLAGCEQPERTAVTHLGTYLLSIRETKPFFNAAPEDDQDVLARLRLIMNFSGGDQTIIDAGMARLALNMLEDYRRDVQLDAALGKYNPVASGAFDFDALKADLEARIEAADNDLFTPVLGQEYGPLGFWAK